MNKLKVVKGKITKESCFTIIREVHLNGKKIGGLKDMTITSSASNSGLVEVYLKLVADVEFVEDNK